MKKWAYLVTKSTCEEVPVGTVLLYKQSHGPTHFETIFNTKTFKMESGFDMELVGPCWVVGGKAQYEKPPQKPGAYTNGIMQAVRKRAAELVRATKNKRKKVPA